MDVPFNIDPQSLGAQEGVSRNSLNTLTPKLQRLVWLVLILSLLLHILVAWLVTRYGTMGWQGPYDYSDTNNIASHSLPTRVLTPQELQQILRNERPVVQTDEATPSQRRLRRNKEDTAHYLGERTQRVEKEMVMKKFGNQEGSAQKFRLQTDKSQQAKKSKDSLTQLGFSGQVSPEVMRFASSSSSQTEADLQQQQQEEKNRIAHGSHDLVDPSISTGAQTLLNTDEYIYASFFNRLKSEVAPRWERLIRALSNDESLKLRAGYYLTEVIFSLDEAGEVRDVNIEKSSHINAFDEAARSSILLLLRVKNPPKSLQDPDGFYRIHLGFTVETGGSAVQFDYVPDSRFPQVR